MEKKIKDKSVSEKKTVKAKSSSKIIENNSQKSEAVDLKVEANLSMNNTHYEPKTEPRPKGFSSQMIEKKVDAFFEANKEFGIKKLVSASKLIESGLQNGMQRKWWNPKMKSFIYQTHINSQTQTIDVLKSLVFLYRAYSFLKDIVQEGGKILFVGTKYEVVKTVIKEIAAKNKVFYVTQRWLGGTFTNFKTVQRSINKLNRYTELEQTGEIKKYSKNEQISIRNEIKKLEYFIGGIKNMRGLPQVVIVTDPVAEKNAVNEARKMKIPVIAIANVNANPDLIDFIIPANTTSIKTQYLLLKILSDAISEAQGLPLEIVGKPDDQIILPEPAKKRLDQSVITHKKFTRFSNQSDSEA